MKFPLRRNFKQIACVERATFEVREGDQFILADPGYESNYHYFDRLHQQRPQASLIKTGQDALLVRMKPGLYDIEFFKNEGPIESWIFKHQDAETFTTKENVSVDVDSGQMGLFLKETAHRDDLISEEKVQAFQQNKHWKDLNLWYAYMCETSNSGQNVNEFGICTSSGYGDGGYIATVFMDANDEIVAVEMIFVKYCRNCEQETFNCRCEDLCPDCGFSEERCRCPRE